MSLLRMLADDNVRLRRRQDVNIKASGPKEGLVAPISAWRPDEATSTSVSNRACSC